VPLKSEKIPTAQLFLYASAHIGNGNHSSVYRASLRLPTPLYARDSPHNVVSVAAKVLSSWYEEGLFDNEAKMYAGFEKYLAEEWCGFNKVEGVKYPVRAAAVVPKFYGYYLPQEVVENTSHWSVRSSPILLLEDCGKQVDPGFLTPYQRYVLPCTCNTTLTRTRHVRIEMYSLFCRLHQANIAQRSAALRNMVMQPGPLTVLMFPCCN
jgi:hypothetical protein